MSCSLKMSTVRDCMQDSGRLFHCVTVYGKNEYLYESFEVNMCLKVCW